MIVDIYGFPVGIFEPFTSEEVSNIRTHMDALVLQEVGKSVLETKDWNAKCLTSAPNGHGEDAIDVEKDEIMKTYLTDDSVVVRAVEDTLRTYLSDIGVHDAIGRPTMYKCGDAACAHCFRDIWVNVYREGHSQDMHWHHDENKGCVFGFVYFVKYDPDVDAKFIFVNPAPEIPVPGMEACPAFRREFTPNVREGTLMFFPSFMLHRVSTQVSGERITVAGNFYCKTS